MHRRRRPQPQDRGGGRVSDKKWRPGRGQSRSREIAAALCRDGAQGDRVSGATGVLRLARRSRNPAVSEVVDNHNSGAAALLVTAAMVCGT